MSSQLPTGTVISTVASAVRRDAIWMSEASVQDLGAIGFALVEPLFAAGVLKNYCGPSKSFHTAAKLAHRGG
jgi:hypothetical protein